VMVTDGQVGFETSVMATVLAGMSRGSRFHAVGVGATPNRTLTGGLARAGRGVELFAMDLAGAHTAAAHLVTATRRPVLTDIRVAGSGVVHSAPLRPRDVLEGQPLVLTAELSPRGGSLVVEGVLAGRPGVWQRVVELPPAGQAGSSWLKSASTTLPVGAIHGREVIADLEMEEAAGAERGATDRGIEGAGLRHRIVSRRTSLVAVSRTPTVDPRDPTRRETLVVELPAGVSAEGLGLLDMRWGGPAGGGSPMIQASVAWEGPASFAEPEGDGMAEYDLAPPAPTARKRSTPPSPPKLKESRASRGERSHWGSEGSSEELEAEVVVHTPERLVVEFQVPRDGFLLPQGEVTVRLPDGRLLTGVVEPGEGTQSGPHPAGVRVRLALKATGGRSWDQAGFPPERGGGLLMVQLLWTRGAAGA
jgi:hypothetical protein